MRDRHWKIIGAVAFWAWTAGLSLAAGTDAEMDGLRAKWHDLLTGGSAYDPNDADLKSAIALVASNGQTPWTAMLKTGGLTRSYLWGDLISNTDSSQITEAYDRLRAMALAYATKGSTLQSNATLRTDIIGGLDWMNAHRYNSTASEYDNWWDWEIGAPQSLNDVVVLLYENLSSTQITNYMSAIEHFTPAPAYTAANLAYTAVAVAVRGVIVKDPAKLVLVRDSLSQLFPYTSSEGFHRDGAYIDHVAFPYTAAYGAALIKDLGNTAYLLKSSTWAIADPNQTNMFNWIYDSFEPLIYKGAAMDLVRGRSISRPMGDHGAGQDIITSLLRWTQLAGTTDALAYKRMIKYWMQQDTYDAFMTNVSSLDALQLAKAIRDDAGIAPLGELVTHRQFPEMDRVVHLRPGFGLGLSMYSSRIFNYESIDGENLKGWFTAEGMTTLYNADLGQFSDGYWPTVDPHRLPGTTVDTLTLTNSAGSATYGAWSWTGGAQIENLYGVAGMNLQSVLGSVAAKKAWFMFDDKIVALGSGISSSAGRTIETIVENRRLVSAGTNALTANGVLKPATLGWSEAMTNVNWVHLAGTNAGNSADIGYYFPGGANVKGLRQARTNMWSDIGTGPATNMTRNYMTLWFDHGASPTGSTYAYVLLPNKSAAQVAAYAAQASVTILENSAAAQAVRETNLNITAVNFWQTASKTVDYITCDKQAAVIARETNGQLEIGVSDPTQANSPAPALGPSADGYVQDGSSSNSNFGTGEELVVKADASVGYSRRSFLKFDLSTVPAAACSSATLLLTVYDLGGATNTVNISSVTNNAWTETGLLWKNQPALGTRLGSAPAGAIGQVISVDVSAFVNAQLAGAKLASFAVTSAATNGLYVSFGSRESSTPPVLQLTGVAGGGVINLELAKTGVAVLTADSRVSVTQLTPTIKLAVNVDSAPPTSAASTGIRGHTWQATIQLAPSILTTNVLPAANAGTAYTQTLAAAGGTAPYTWSTTNALPTGLTLSSDGVISGTPSMYVSGTFNLTVRVTDGASGSATKLITLAVNNAFETWRAAHFAAGALADSNISGPDADPDHDGLTNLQEYFADTDPNDSASRLALLNIAVLTNTALITWIGGTNATQVIECSGNLANTNAWTAIFTNTPPTPATNTTPHTGAGSASNLFYRVKAWR